MTINEVIKSYLDNNFDSRLMLDINNNFTIYKNNNEILPVLVDQFILWAAENEDEHCRDNPVYLFNYCCEHHDFGAICTLYYEDVDGNFIKEMPI